MSETLKQGILFVWNKEKTKKSSATKVIPLVLTRNDWKMFIADLHTPLDFSPQILVASLRLNLVLWADSLNTVLLAVLTVLCRHQRRVDI